MDESVGDPVPQDLTYLPTRIMFRTSPLLRYPLARSHSRVRLSQLSRWAQCTPRAGPDLQRFSPQSGHHQTNSRFGLVNLVDTTASATAEIAHALRERLRVAPTLEAATALMTGLVTDTLGFRTDSVTPRTLALAAHLLEAGAPLTEICYRTFQATRYEKLKPGEAYPSGNDRKTDASSGRQSRARCRMMWRERE